MRSAVWAGPKGLKQSPNLRQLARHGSSGGVIQFKPANSSLKPCYPRGQVVIHRQQQQGLVLHNPAPSATLFPTSTNQAMTIPDIATTLREDAEILANRAGQPAWLRAIASDLEAQASKLRTLAATMPEGDAPRHSTVIPGVYPR